MIRPSGPDSEAHWAKLEDELHKITSDETISQRLLARALDMLPVVHATIDVFARAAAAKFGSQRHGDQYGTLLAGCWCLTHDAVPTAEQAQALLDRYEWAEHTEGHDEDDASEALKAVLNAKIRMPGSVTVFELIQDAHPGHRVGRIDQGEADAALRRHGIRVETSASGDYLLFGTGVPNLKDLVRHSAFSTDLRGQLLRLPDATRWNDKTMKFAGAASKCIAIPLAPLFDDGHPGAAPVDDYPL